jgi:hypothetical protein
MRSMRSMRRFYAFCAFYAFYAWWLVACHSAFYAFPAVQTQTQTDYYQDKQKLCQPGFSTLLISWLSSWLSSGLVLVSLGYCVRSCRPSSLIPCTHGKITPCHYFNQVSVRVVAIFLRTIEKRDFSDCQSKVCTSRHSAQLGMWLFPIPS